MVVAPKVLLFLQHYWNRGVCTTGCASETHYSSKTRTTTVRGEGVNVTLCVCQGHMNTFNSGGWWEVEAYLKSSSFMISYHSNWCMMTSYWRHW